MLADVVLPSRRFQVYTYSIPHQLQDQVFVGTPVLIPLGTSVVSGVVVRIFENSALPSSRSTKHTIVCRDILSIEVTPEHSSLNQKLLKLVEQIADYYLAPLSACLRLIVPPRMGNVTKRLVLTEVGRQALVNSSMLMEERVVLQKLSRGTKGMLRSSMLRTLPEAIKIVSKLKKKRWIEEYSAVPMTGMVKKQGVSYPRPGSGDPSSFGGMGDLFEQGFTKSSKHSLTQCEISENLKGMLDAIVNEGLSGKFQKDIVIGTHPERLHVFQHIACAMLQREKQVLLLLPEVHQVNMVFGQLRGVLTESVETYHGKLSTSDRANRWEKIRQGQVQLVIGTRSALFLPFSNLGLIWVDQEEDGSYKDEHMPYYHAREVAGMRGTIEQALVLYGTSLPSLETYVEFREKILKNFSTIRYKNPKVNLIDMPEHVSATLLTPSLISRLTEVLNEGQQAIFILNRKGFSQSLICVDCGKASMCEKCGVSLRLFQRPSRMMCSYCRKPSPLPETCSSCMGTVFRFFGVGTQRLEEELTKVFPSFILSRFDRDQVKTADEGMKVLSKFRQREISILIGTEYLLHQSDLPTAKLVAFPQADLGLHLPDFRSAERTFLLFSRALQLVQANTQINASFGEVYLQTRMPHHHVFQSISQHDPHIFYQEELDLRAALAYPPLAHILLLVVTGAKTLQVQRVVNFLEQQLKDKMIPPTGSQREDEMFGLPMVLGPLVSQKAGHLKKNRTIFLIKTFYLEETQRHLRRVQQAFDQEFRSSSVVYEVHVDPLEIQ